MVAVVQVDRNLVPAKGGCGGRQAIFEPDDRGFAVPLQARWGWVHTVEAPHVCGREALVKRMEARLGIHYIHKVGWRELLPALMVRSRGFRWQVRRLLWRRNQLFKIYCGEWGSEFIQKRNMAWTRSWIY